MTYQTKLSPCANQTAAEIETYYRNEPEGSVAVVRRTHGGILIYEVSRFDLRRSRSGRINVRSSGDFYMKSGKNCWESTGQTRLVVPTDEVLTWAKEHPRGEMGYTIYAETWERRGRQLGNA
ncbi:hypothetical protein FHX08_000269 [Rhizobium sp. BK529]|nr:hypothetical protein [Rhizobium sp. BK529]